MKNLLLLFAVVAICSCGSDVDCDPNSFAADVNAEVDKVNAIGVDFANDPSEENCKSYKKAAEEYLDAVEAYKNCDGIDQNQFSQQLSQARQLLDIIPCN